MTSEREQCDLEALWSHLRRLYAEVGRPPYRQLRDHAERAGLKLPPSTAQELIAGRRTPRWTTVHAFVAACTSYAQNRRPPMQIAADLTDFEVLRALFDAAHDPGNDDFGSAASLSVVVPTPRRSLTPAKVQTSGATYAAVTWDVCLTFMLAVDAAHGVLRDVARQDQPDRYGDANRAVHNAAVYAHREHLLVAATPEVVQAGEAAFLRLIAVRDAIRTGATLESAAYHSAYHPFAEALWAFRLAVRAAFGRTPLTPQALDRKNWSDRERCTVCDETK